MQKLEGHQDEVWHVQFSHGGDRLASASKDRTAIIWAVPPSGDAKQLLTLTGHPDSVTHLSWSRDDTKLLTCSSHQVTASDYIVLLPPTPPLPARMSSLRSV